MGKCRTMIQIPKTVTVPKANITYNLVDFVHLSLHNSRKVWFEESNGVSYASTTEGICATDRTLEQTDSDSEFCEKWRRV